METCSPTAPAVAVIVPVYNAADSLRTLVASLDAVYRVPRAGLHFHFIDDGSTDPGLDDVWRCAFFARADVSLHRNSRNVGFVRTVNWALNYVAGACDVVLLNSDTEIFDDAFGELRREAYSSPEIASVTPLTNNGTIASLFAFPAGSDVPPSLPRARVAQIVRTLALPSPVITAPTGVGFCMYIKREAIATVGGFDEVYEAGYGEETDWCQRARKLGRTHLISTRTFVYHAGTKSFTPSEKERLIRKHTEIMLARYPQYHEDVWSYCAQNPLKFHRLRIVLELLRAQTRVPMVLFTLHSDPDSGRAAGTERHVRDLERKLALRHGAALELIPKGASFRLRGWQAGHKCLDELFDSTCAASLFGLLAENVDVLHAHHFGWWSDDAIDALLGAPFRRRLITVHDLALVCPSVDLLTGPGRTRFCGVESDPTACNRCLKDVIGYRRGRIEDYRAQSLRRLRQFDGIVVPSKEMLRLVARAFPDDPATVSRIAVVEHDISTAADIARRTSAAAPRSGTARPVVAFVGHFGKHKGGELILDSCSALEAAGFQVKVAGQFIGIPARRSERLHATPHRTLAELADWLAACRPMIVAHPSLTAESFCYAFYECLLLAPQAIPVVGPFGHPAEIVRQAGIGVVIETMTTPGLVAACERARHDYAALMARRAAYREHLLSTWPEVNYVALLQPTGKRGVTTPAAGRAQAASHRTMDLAALSLLEFQSRRARELPASWRGRLASRVPYLAQLRSRYWEWRKRLDFETS